MAIFGAKIGIEILRFQRQLLTAYLRLFKTYLRLFKTTVYLHFLFLWPLLAAHVIPYFSLENWQSGLKRELLKGRIKIQQNYTKHCYDI